MSGTVRVHDDLLLAACKWFRLLFLYHLYYVFDDIINSESNQCLLYTAEALAAQTTKENHAKGLIYPPFTNIRKISAHIAANVAAKAYELGKCWKF